MSYIENSTLLYIFLSLFTNNSVIDFTLWISSSENPTSIVLIFLLILSEKSIHFLQNGINTISNRSQLLLDKYFDYFNNNLDSVNFKNEHYCITGSIIMEMYGLRSAKDIDYITKDSDIIGIKDIDIHNGKWLSYYNVDKHDIIYNPKYHFYFNGFKYSSKTK